MMRQMMRIKNSANKMKGFQILKIFHCIIHRQLPQCKFKTYVQFVESFWNNFFNLNFNQFFILTGISLNDNWIKKSLHFVCFLLEENGKPIFDFLHEFED
jgi:hypothetical protein